ncbi:uncharacterized protein LOC117547363 isoform X2 [Gymnodraco acuticeps]|uniref:Uncharacterized protein LOC117547363 isoform X2 n=1 Tax=Gymnodraco acuticeps TaxID=8218 RepID=A0A6P8UB18_GYMAC|nr:uncharacterized protein LOC117547363 isoform X2 [Gymnodraco acuticeps]
MLPYNQFKTVGMMPWERYVTTYNRDFPPVNERQPQVNQPKSRTEAQAAPSFISPPQTERETWPIFHHNFYKMSNSAYGSGLQPPSCSLFPASLHAFGFLLGEEAESRLHCVFDPKANVLEPQEARDEPQQKLDVLYEEDAGNCDGNAYWRGWEPASGLTNSSFLQPTSISCYAWDPECSNSYFKMQTCPPRSSTLTPAHIQPTFQCAEPSRTQPMTEYQSRYSAAWAQPKMQQSYGHHRH